MTPEGRDDGQRASSCHALFIAALPYDETRPHGVVRLLREWSLRSSGGGRVLCLSFDHPVSGQPDSHHFDAQSGLL